MTGLNRGLATVFAALMVNVAFAGYDGLVGDDSSQTTPSSSASTPATMSDTAPTPVSTPAPAATTPTPTPKPPTVIVVPVPTPAPAPTNYAPAPQAQPVIQISHPHPKAPAETLVNKPKMPAEEVVPPLKHTPAVKNEAVKIHKAILKSNAIEAKKVKVLQVTTHPKVIVVKPVVAPKSKAIIVTPKPVIKPKLRKEPRIIVLKQSKPKHHYVVIKHVHVHQCYVAPVKHRYAQPKPIHHYGNCCRYSVSRHIDHRPACCVYPHYVAPRHVECCVQTRPRHVYHPRSPYFEDGLPPFDDRPVQFWDGTQF